MTPPHFLWPKPNIRRTFTCSVNYVSVEEIEEKLANMFPVGFPVLFSSGRAALYHSLLYSGLRREDRVGVFPFASHCILDAVSRITTPTQIGRDARLNVVFQQWGYIQYRDISSCDIEDCVDSLVVPGGKLFPGGGAFEIWSLPKILGTSGGGILWCRSCEAANGLRRIRGKNAGASLLWGLRLLGMYSSLLHACWQGAEPPVGRPTRLQTGELMAAIDSWQEVVTDRRRKLALVRSLAPKWLSFAVDRLPCVVPILLNQSCDGEALARKAGISSGQRMIERKWRGGNGELVRVLPLPIHQDVSVDQLSLMMNLVTPHLRTTH